MILEDWGLLLVLVGVSFLIYYTREKAKNLARKEDLDRLTDIVERVRSRFEKANLVHRIQFEAEFRHYERIWKASHVAFKAHVKLYPVAGEPIPKPTQKEFDAFIRAQLDFAEAMDDCKPFIPDELWKVFYDFDTELIEAKVQGLTGTQRADVRKYRTEVRMAFEKCAARIAKRLSDLLVVESV